MTDATSDQRFSAIQQFWERVDRSGPCWTWIGPTYDEDTPIASVGGATIQALPHRFAAGWIREVPLNSATRVTRTCGHEKCVRPGHLTVQIDSSGSARSDAPSDEHDGQKENPERAGEIGREAPGRGAVVGGGGRGAAPGGGGLR